MFTGKTIRLTAMRKEDLEDYRRWNSIPSFGRNYNSFPVRELSEKKTEDWFHEHTDKDYRFAIRPLDTEEFIGVCAIEDVVWPHRVGWLSIAIGPDFHGKGMGRDAMEVLIRYGFNELNLHRIQLTVFSYNEPAIKLYKKLGFKHEGTFREFLQRDGKRFDMHLYGLLSDEWEVGQE